MAAEHMMMAMDSVGLFLFYGALPGNRLHGRHHGSFHGAALIQICLIKKKLCQEHGRDTEQHTQQDIEQSRPGQAAFHQL